jgi:hypothetical protein
MSASFASGSSNVKFGTVGISMGARKLVASLPGK